MATDKFQFEFGRMQKMETGPITTEQIRALKLEPGATYLIVVHRSENIRDVAEAVNVIALTADIKGAFLQVDDMDAIKVFRVSPDEVPSI